MLMCCFASVNQTPIITYIPGLYSCPLQFPLTVYITSVYTASCRFVRSRNFRLRYLTKHRRLNITSYNFGFKFWKVHEYFKFRKKLKRLMNKYVLWECWDILQSGCWSRMTYFLCGSIFMDFNTFSWCLKGVRMQ